MRHKIAAAEFAKSRGQRDAGMHLMAMGRHSFVRVLIKGSVGASNTFAPASI